MKVYKEFCKEDGAILFCVARGKFTEGHNFGDNLCRGLFIIGVPNLNLRDPKILLKFLYFNKGISVKTINEMFKNQQF